MSSQTPNLNLTLPIGSEKVSRQIINDNNSKIDTAVGALNDKIANVINVGQFSASGSGVETKITDSISKVTTGGVTVNFTANPSSSGTAYVSGFLYPNKDYGGGYYIDTYRQAYWYLNNGTLTVFDLNDKIITGTYNVSMTIPADDKAELDITNTITKSGYSIAIVMVAGISSVIMPTVEISSNKYYVLARNFSSSQQSTTIIVNVLYIR